MQEMNIAVIETLKPLGAEAAGGLGAWMQSMDAHRTEIGELRREMQLGFAKIDERFCVC
jgi:hypothetical protein